MIGVNPKMETLVLTKGTGFQATFHDNADWPAGAQAQLTFYDSAGGVFAVLEGEFSGKDINFDERAAVVDVIPHGASFTFTVTLAGYDPVALSYGMAIRKEPRFPDAPPSQDDDTALLFTDDFQRVVLGPRWIQVPQPRDDWQQTVAYTNRFGMMGMVVVGGTGSVLYYRPLNSDAATINVSIFGDTSFQSGVTSIILCSDSNMTSYLAFVVEVDPNGTYNKWHIAKATGSGTEFSQVEINHTTVGVQNFTIIYNDQTDTVQVFHNDDFSAPVLSLSNIGIMHGLGYRYVGANFVPQHGSTVVSGGKCPMLTRWQAQDGIVIPNA
jgi:hypothetical protein